MPETLREKATKKLQGPDANPSQPGDPISMKAEQSDNVPTEGERGAHESPQPSSNNKDKTGKTDENGERNGDGESLREKAMKKLHGPNANPSQLGDPISLKAETSDKIPAGSEEGAHNKGDSKL
ncbi:hypothetical protein F4818DRAFT_427441 [Hypoxylon cercidicola]|nr:hypothetical protein F4818DRAFT_427441 [Hypoxylon cercidicola]